MQRIQFNDALPSNNVLLVGANASFFWMTSNVGDQRPIYAAPCSISPAAGCINVPPGRIRSARFHPADPNTLGLLVKTPPEFFSCSPASSAAFCTRYELWLTTNFGGAWTSALDNSALAANASAPNASVPDTIGRAHGCMLPPTVHV